VGQAQAKGSGVYLKFMEKLKRSKKIYYHFAQLRETLFSAVIVWLIASCLRRKGFVTIFSFPPVAFSPRRVLAGGFALSGLCLVAVRR
jgi:hypothetical protein